jgi:hypothetical protein
LSAFALHCTNECSLFQALLGWLCFGEPLPLLWWVGATFILVGISFILQGQMDAESSAGAGMDNSSKVEQLHSPESEGSFDQGFPGDTKKQR